MDQQEVLSLLEENQNQKGIEKWNNRYSEEGALKSFGIGLTVLRKLAKKIGRDHELAMQLWKSDLYDVKIISLLIDDPKKITREQAEIQVDHLNQGHLAHVFSSCDASLAKSDFAVDLALDWVYSDSIIRKSCGYGLIYELSKSKKKSIPDDDFFQELIEHIDLNFHNEHISVQGSMGAALLGIGKRSARLNEITLRLARKLGPIQLESEGKYCEPLDVVKHLTSDYIQEKFGINDYSS